ncbi:MAG: site-2 protease family protein [Anaerolineaceae bacterium]|nr:MAG: site-2 protease family protein [Anaerolineaceae bacterium]
MTFAVVLIGWIFSLCLHEFGHAIVAYYGGDTTVKDKGYLTFNPLKYTHPLYSIVLPVVFLLMGGIGLPGGAVYIETWRLKNRTWQSLVSLAGPVANLIVLIVLGIVLKFVPWENYDANNSIWPGIAFLALLQASALVLNLIPLPPFDGYGILEPFLKDGTRDWMNSMRTWIMLIVFLALWNIPMVNNLFWTQVYIISSRLGVPWELAWDGFDRFRFWLL